MILRLPSYYKEFSCIADRCQHSCCLGWEIDIDEETWEYYRSIQGPFGERLRANMISQEENSFRLREGNRCPFLNQNNLCDIYAELGETSLCAICTEYPRQTLEYADVRERCLSISCEEVGRILFGIKEPVSLKEQEMEDIRDSIEISPEEYWEDEDLIEEDSSSVIGGSEEDDIDSLPEDFSDDDEVAFEYAYAESEDQEDCPEAERGEHLKLVRDHAIRILQRRRYPIEYRIVRCLRFAREVQEYINQDMWEEMDGLPALEGEWGSMSEEAGTMGEEDGFEARSLVLKDMEILDDEWESVFAEVCRNYENMDHEERREMISDFMTYYRESQYQYEQLMVYFVTRYCLKAVFDYQFLGKLQFAVLSFLTIRDMDAVHFGRKGSFDMQDRIDLARIYSREVEHSEDNLDYLADEFVFNQELSWEGLARQVMFGIEF